jgi:thiamine biosynthesis protein ThiS
VPGRFGLQLLQPPQIDLETELIEIRLNGEVRQVPARLTVAGLLDFLEFPADRVAVERNLEIVPRPQWKVTLIETGDRLEVVHFVGGGSGRRGASS